MFVGRREAARALAEKLSRYKHREDALILAVPRGGVVLGAVLSEELGLPLDVILTKKIGHPSNPEFAIGSASLSGEAVDAAVIERDRIPTLYIDTMVARIRESLRQRYAQYRGSSRPLDVAGKTVILTDDGAATGRTLAAAIEVLRRDRPAKIVLAVPVAGPHALEYLRRAADETICLEAPRDFCAIGEYYGDFTQVSDAEALGLLQRERSVAEARGRKL